MLYLGKEGALRFHNHPNVLGVFFHSIFTLRILGRVFYKRETKIPLALVEDYADVLPKSWLKKGGVLAPVRPNQIISLRFHTLYPWAVKIGSGKVNLINNSPWQDSLDPDAGDFIKMIAHTEIFSEYKAADGTLRQLVVSPLGRGVTIEEQVAGTANIGGIQLIAYSMIVPETEQSPELGPVSFCKLSSSDLRAMGLAAGTEIEPEEEIDASPEVEEEPMPMPEPEPTKENKVVNEKQGIWDTDNYNRCFIHLIDERDFLEITGRKINGKKAKLYSMAYWRSKGEMWSR